MTCLGSIDKLLRFLLNNSYQKAWIYLNFLKGLVSATI